MVIRQTPQFLMLLCFVASILAKDTYDKLPADTTFNTKPATVGVYVAARNDLADYWDRNAHQLRQVGTNANLNILAHVNTTVFPRKKLTQRFIIFKNKLVQIGDNDALDSGDPQTLFNACAWIFAYFPADMKIVVIWNHGSGSIEPIMNKIMDPSQLYRYNHETQLIQLDRSIDLDERLGHRASDRRGICFDDLTKRYITNKQAGDSLQKVVVETLGGTPFDIVCCDACMMACIEFAYALKPYGRPGAAHFLVASQEVVLATGLPYTKVFAKLANLPQSPQAFSEHIVTSFAQAYQSITSDYTQSAIDLTQMDQLYEDITAVASILIEGLKGSGARSVQAFIKAAGSKDKCTHFEDSSQKDLHHLLSNMLASLGAIQLVNAATTQNYRLRLGDALRNACADIGQCVVKHAEGASVARARGISIYFPNGIIHPSYLNNDFGKATGWLEMLKLLYTK